VLRERNQRLLDKLLRLPQGAVMEGEARRKAYALYRTCMDEEAVEARAAGPALSLYHEAEFTALGGTGWSTEDREALTRSIVALGRAGVSAFFSFYVSGDDKNSTQTAAFLGQGGLSLPAKSYYLGGKQPTSDPVLMALVEGFKTLLTLLAVEPTEAARRAMLVVEFEQEVAALQREKEDLRDPDKAYNPFSVVVQTQPSPPHTHLITDHPLIHPTIHSSIHPSIHSYVVLGFPTACL